MWEIVDGKGVVYSGEEEEMTTLFQEIREGGIELDWTGDLKLLQVVDVLK